MAEEKSKEWEQPWPPNKIRQQSTNWNLAGDAGVLLYLRQASSDLMSRLENAKKGMGDLADETQKTVIRLDNTINDFSRLANNQFIENRVYDDDAKFNRDQKPKQDVVKTKEEREAEMVGTMKTALDTGCAVLDSHFTKIEVRPLDFDEDDDPSFSPQPVFEPRDPYSNRPLPYVIATQDFMRSEFVGLREDEDELQASKKQEALSESDDEAVTPTPAAGYKPVEPQLTVIQPIASVAKPIPGTISPSPDEKPGSDSSGSGLFGTSPGSGEHAFPSATTKQKIVDQNGGQIPRNLASDLHSELTNKLTGAGAPSKEKPKPKESVVPASKATVTDDADEDVLYPPPPLLPRQAIRRDDSDDEGGLFKPRTRGLFDDDEDEEENKPPSLPRRRLEELADPRRNAAPAKSVEQPVVTGRDQPRAVSLVPPSPTVQPSTASPQSSTVSKPKTVSVFADDDDNEDDDDLFGNNYKKEPVASKKIPSSTIPTSDDQSSKKPAAIITRPTQPIRGIGGGAGLFGDEDDEDDDLFAVLKLPKSQADSKSKGLFSDNTGTITKEQATKGSKPATVTSSPSTNITQDQKNDAVETSKPVSIPTAVTKPVSDSLFSRSPSPPSSTIPKVSLPKKETATSSKKTGGLFGEDSDDDSLFPQAAVVKTKPVQKSGGEESSQKKAFRAELANKLLAGPQPGGLIKPTLANAADEREKPESSPAQSPMPSKPIPAQESNGIDVDDDDLYSPPAHGLFGNNSDDVVDSVEKVSNFDAATNVETLPTLQKNRAKLPNRRPPSKHAPRVPIEQNGIDRPAVNEDASQTKEKVAVESFNNLGSINADPLGVETSPASTSSLEPSPPKIPEDIPKTKKPIVEKEETPVSKSKAAAILFEDDEDDDLFGKLDKKLQKPTAAKVVKQESKTVAPTTTTVSTSSSKATPRGGGGGLFSDEDDDDLFSDTKRAVAKKPVQPVVDEDIFSTKKISAAPQQKPTPTPAPAQSNKKGKSLFDDDDDDIDIFR